MPVIEDVAASSVTAPPVGTDKVGASFTLPTLTVKSFEVVSVPSVAATVTE